MPTYIIRVEMLVNGSEKKLYFEDLHTNDTNDQINSIIPHFCKEKRKALKFIDHEEVSYFARFLGRNGRDKITIQVQPE